MRSKIMSACLVAALLTPATMQAQQRFNKALRDFVSKVKENAGKTAKKSALPPRIVDYRMEAAGSDDRGVEIYAFSLKGKQQKWLDDIYTAYEQDRYTATKSFRKDASGTPVKTKKGEFSATTGGNGVFVKIPKVKVKGGGITVIPGNIAFSSAGRYLFNYGKDYERSFTLGNSLQDNVLILTKDDNVDTKLRYAYAIEWAKRPETGTIEGRICFIHSMRPDVLEQEKRSRAEADAAKEAEQVNGWTQWGRQLGELAIDRGAMETLERLSTRLGELITAFENEASKLSPAERKRREKEINALADKINNLAKKLQKRNGGGVVSFSKNFPFDDEAEAAEMSAEDFLSNFEGLRRAFQSNGYLRPTLANRLLSLCKDNAQNLSQNEREICAKALGELAQRTDDSFTIGLLKEAQEQVRKTPTNKAKK